MYPMDFLIKLQNIFLGLVSSEAEPEEEERRPSVEEKVKPGEEMSDEDVDGVPLDGAALLKAGARPASRDEDEESLDGEPLPGPGQASALPSRPQLETEATRSAAKSGGGFVTSKWETVDPEEVKAGAMTTSKWEREETDQLLKARRALMGSVASKWDEKAEDIDGDPINDDSDNDFPELDTRVTEERRQLLREVEVKVMQYQDELEGGRKGIKAGWTISDQVEHYRKKLLRKAAEKQEEAEVSDSPNRSERSSRSDRDKEKSKKKKRRRSKSDSSSRSRSRDRDRDRDRDKKSRRRRRSSDSSDQERDSRRRGKSRDRRSRSRSKSSKRQSKRSRSRSRSPRKHKKKRH